MKTIPFKGLIFFSSIMPLVFLLSGQIQAFAGDKVKPRVHPTLELYAHDAADECVNDGMQIRVTAQNIYPKGILKLEIYNSEDGFLFKKGRLRKVRLEAKDSPMLVCLNISKTGRYAIAGYHDLDGDRKLKKKWDFTPKEPYGLSNNPVYKSRRLPKFEEAAFTVGENGADVEIFFKRVGKS